MLLVMKIDSLIHSMLKSVRSISDVTFLQPDLDQLKVFLICLLKARRTFVLNVATSLLQKRIGLGQTDNVMFSLPYPGYLQQNRDNGGLLVHGLCAPEK